VLQVPTLHRAGELGPRLRHLGEDRLLLLRVALHRLHQVRDEIGAPLEPHLATSARPTSNERCNAFTGIPPYVSRFTNSAVRSRAARYAAGSGSPAPNLSVRPPVACATSAVRLSGGHPMVVPASRTSASGASGGVLP